MLLGTIILLSVLMVIVTLHEAGHLVMAKKYGVNVPVFSIGFGPRLIGFKFFKDNRNGWRVAYKLLNGKPSNKYVWKKGATEYRLAPIPFGGFCSMEGELRGTTEESLSERPYYQKFLIVAGGIIVNLVTGFLAIAGLMISKLDFSTGLKATVLFTKDMLNGVYTQTVALVTGQIPLTHWREIAEASAGLFSVEGIIIQFGFYSIILALFNALPIPPLDGSFPFLWSLEKVLGKKRGQTLAGILATIGFVVLMGLQLWMVYYWIFM